ncbi:hypothetical protein IQ06DRAFT_345935 [Phaeosphaeriaceae sp. SRC1lsM3a]|nr:hypothetical protein IQ06DRAFT_345935 [Stagonospora sp. SRC1lsM3a]
MNTSKYATTNPSSPSPDNDNPTSPPPVFNPSIAVADLGSARFNHDTAQITDRDASLLTGAPVTVRQGRAPAGLENQAFAWSTFQYTTTERDEREEKKGELHEGVLHRLNRAARGENAGGVSEREFGGRGGRGGRAGRGRWGGGREMGRDDGKGDALCAGRKMEANAAPLAKGMAEEMEKRMFWDGPIV